MPRNIVVTGAGSGIGHAAAEFLRIQGETIIGADLRNAKYEVDLTNSESIANFAKAVEDKYGHIDAIIANAGVSTSSVLDLLVNYYGVIDSINALKPLLERSPAPRIAVTASAASLQHTDEKLVDLLLNGSREDALAYGKELKEAGPARAYSNYSGSKRAIATWVRRVAPTPEFAGKGIAINAVGPGVVASPMTEKLLSTKEGRQIAFGAMPAPLNGAASPRSIAAVLAFLVSEVNASMTGQIIYIDGGFDASSPLGRGEDLWHNPKRIDD